MTQRIPYPLPLKGSRAISSVVSRKAYGDLLTPPSGHVLSTRAVHDIELFIEAHLRLRLRIQMRFKVYLSAFIEVLLTSSLLLYCFFVASFLLLDCFCIASLLLLGCFLVASLWPFRCFFAHYKRYFPKKPNRHRPNLGPCTYRIQSFRHPTIVGVEAVV